LITVCGEYGERVERASEILPALRWALKIEAAGGVEYDLQAPGKWMDTVYGK